MVLQKLTYLTFTPVVRSVVNVPKSQQEPRSHAPFIHFIPLPFTSLVDIFIYDAVVKYFLLVRPSTSASCAQNHKMSITKKQTFSVLRLEICSLFLFSSPINLLVCETCRFRCGKSSTYNSLVFFVLAYSSFLFIHSSSAAPAEAATFYQPLYCLSLPLSIRADKVAVSSVSDSNITFSRVSHSP